MERRVKYKMKAGLKIVGAFLFMGFSASCSSYKVLNIDELISELKQSVELLKNSNELLQDAISGEVGSLKDEVKENTVQEVRKALQANIEAIQRATKLLEKQSDTLTSVMKQKIRELEESKNNFFRYEGLKLYLFWGGMVCNILVFLMLASSMFGR